jgi:hypothetical protein
VSPAPRLRQATVVSVQPPVVGGGLITTPATLTLLLGGEADPALAVTGVRFLEGYFPIPDESCWVLENDSDYLAIGRLTPVEPLFARKTATESVTSSTVMQDDDHLTLTVADNAIYQVEMVVRYDGASGTGVGELKMQFVMPAGAGFTGLLHGHQFAAIDNTGDLIQAVLDGAVMQTGTRGASTFLAAHVVGMLVVGTTAGTFKLQWAQDSSNATPTRLIVGSHLSLRRVSYDPGV